MAAEVADVAVTTVPKFVPETWRSVTVRDLQSVMVGATSCCVTDGTVILHVAAASCCCALKDEISLSDVLVERDAVRTAVKPLVHREASMRVEPMRRRTVVAVTLSGEIV